MEATLQVVLAMIHTDLGINAINSKLVRELTGFHSTACSAVTLAISALRQMFRCSDL